MYAFADRISDTVTASPQRRKMARLAANRAKTRKNAPGRRKNRPFCEDEASLLHYGNNGAKTFRLRQFTLRNAYFSCRKPPEKRVRRARES
jgi:hypothetical protein